MGLSPKSHLNVDSLSVEIIKRSLMSTQKQLEKSNICLKMIKMRRKKKVRIVKINKSLTSRWTRLEKLMTS